jgi:hypothetical protein
MSLVGSLFAEGKIYLIIYLWLFFLVVLESCREYKKYQLLMAGSTVSILIIFTGVRWETGTDWPAYFKLFDTLEFNWAFLLNVYNFDLGYVLFNALIKLFTNSYTVFLLIDSFTALGLIFLFLKKFSPNPNLSLFVFYNAFFVSQFMGSNRRMIALALILFALYFIFIKKRGKYTFTYIIAGLFHSSAFLTVIAYFIPLKRYSSKQLTIGLASSLVIGIFQLPFKILGWLGNLLSSFAGNPLIDKLTTYSSSDDDIVIGNTNPVVLVTLSIIKRCVFLIFYFIIIKRKKGLLDPLTDFFFNIYIAGFAIYMLLNGSLVFQVISTYFTFIEIVLIGRMWNYADKDLKLKFLGVLFIYGFFQLLSALSAYPELYIPYKTFLSI